MSQNYKYLPAQKIIDHLHTSLSGLRTSRANASVLDSIRVDYYGSMMQIKELSTITIPEPAQLFISPFDKGAIKPISDAITKSNLGINPVDDGVGVRLVFPPMTEETRKKLAKNVSTLMEETKITVRNARQDLLKKWKKQKEDSEISEDELKRLESELQEEVNNLNKQIEQDCKKKEQEILKI